MSFTDVEMHSLVLLHPCGGTQGSVGMKLVQFGHVRVLINKRPGFSERQLGVRTRCLRRGATHFRCWMLTTILPPAPPTPPSDDQFSIRPRAKRLQMAPSGSGGLPQGHFNMRTVGAGNHAGNLAVKGKGKWTVLV